MTAPNFSLPYPPVLNNTNNLQYIKAVIPAGVGGTTLNVYTTAQSTVGKFFVTNVVIHDPAVFNATPSTIIAIGSASTSTTAISGQNLWLSNLTGTVANQYVQFQPGNIPGNAAPGVGPWGGLTTTIVATTTLGNVSLPAGVAFAPGDVLQVTIVQAHNTTTQTYYLDLIGYYI